MPYGNTEKLSIYIPKRYQDKKPVQRLRKLARKQESSVNFLVLDAILKYIEREEKAQARD